MPGQVIKGPPTPQHLNEEKKKLIDKKSDAVVDALKGIPISDVGMVFQTAQQKILKRKV